MPRPKRREIPDVAFPAAPVYPIGLAGGATLVGGTSAAAPAMAGAVALLTADGAVWRVTIEA